MIVFFGLILISANFIKGLALKLVIVLNYGPFNIIKNILVKAEGVEPDELY